MHTDLLSLIQLHSLLHTKAITPAIPPRRKASTGCYRIRGEVKKALDSTTYDQQCVSLPNNTTGQKGPDEKILTDDV